MDSNKSNQSELSSIDCVNKPDPVTAEAKQKKFEEKMKRREQIEAELKAKQDKLTDTPFDKIKLPIDADYNNLVLALTGSFYPIHNNHLRMLTKVKEHFEKNLPEYSIIGGYIVPTHGSGLKRKVGVKPDSRQRVEMLQAAVEDLDWVSVDPYLAAQKANMGVGHATQRLEKLLNDKFSNLGRKKKD